MAVIEKVVEKIFQHIFNAHAKKEKGSFQRFQSVAKKPTVRK